MHIKLTCMSADDLEPVDDQGEYETHTRQNSSVHIRVFRTALHGAHR